MFQQKFGARAEYQEQQRARVRSAASLAATYRQLKELTVEFSVTGLAAGNKPRPVKYSVNLDNAKAVFRLGCPNQECVHGDFDLSATLANAVAEGRTSVKGEVPCPGWRSRVTIDKLTCDSVLSYQLRLGY